MSNLKSVKKLKRDRTSNDNDNELLNFKGIHFDSNVEEKFYEGGAHFSYNEFYSKLEKVCRSLSPSRMGREIKKIVEINSNTNDSFIYKNSITEEDNIFKTKNTENEKYSDKIKLDTFKKYKLLNVAKNNIETNINKKINLNSNNKSKITNIYNKINPKNSNSKNKNFRNLKLKINPLNLDRLIYPDQSISKTKSILNNLKKTSNLNKFKNNTNINKAEYTFDNTDILKTNNCDKSYFITNDKIKFSNYFLNTFSKDCSKNMPQIKNFTLNNLNNSSNSIKNNFYENINNLNINTSPYLLNSHFSNINLRNKLCKKSRNPEINLTDRSYVNVNNYTNDSGKKVCLTYDSNLNMNSKLTKNFNNPIKLNLYPSSNISQISPKKVIKILPKFYLTNYSQNKTKENISLQNKRLKLNLFNNKNNQINDKNKISKFSLLNSIDSNLNKSSNKDSINSYSYFHKLKK